MWDNAFQIGDWNQGFAAAVGLVGTAAMLVVVLWLFYLFRSRD
jgi:ABC-type sugar transport system permease subunit